MPYKIRRSGERKFFDHDWLKTFHTFSFGSYHDPQFMGFQSLRVINEDRVAPGHGFPTHGHKNMEIISLVLAGELAHQDSMGHISTLKPNEVQVMSAGSGVTHSEYNPSTQEVAHFLQIWILPHTENVTSSYQQSTLPEAPFYPWFLIASNEGRERSLKIHQDVNLYALSLEKGNTAEKRVELFRKGWIQVLEGELKFGPDILYPGDGVALISIDLMTLTAVTSSRLLFFDLS